MTEVDPTWNRVERKIDDERMSQVDLMLGTFRNFWNERGEVVSPSDLVYAYLPDEFETSFVVLVGTKKALDGVRVKPRSHEILPVVFVRTDVDSNIIQTITLKWNDFGAQITRNTRDMSTTDMIMDVFVDEADTQSRFIDVVFIGVQGEPDLDSSKFFDGACARIDSIPTSA